MEKKILWALIGLLTISTAFNWIKQDEPINYDYFIKERNRLHEELKELDHSLKTQDNEIKRIKLKMVENDSIIDGASRPELDVLFSNFFDRVR